MPALIKQSVEQAIGEDRTLAATTGLINAGRLTLVPAEGDGYVLVVVPA